MNQNPRRPASPVRPPESICRRLSPRYAVARSFSDGASRSRPACRQAAPKRSRPTPPAPTARRSARAPAAWRRATSPPRRARGSSKGRQATQHSAYRFEFVTAAYRWHPLHGRRLRAHQGARRDARDVVLVEDRPGLTRELPAWMCDAAACSAMTFGPPLVQVDAPWALSAFLATLLQARTASRSSEPPKKEEVTDEPADETATKTACVEPGAGDRGAGEGAGVKSDSCWINLPEAFPPRALFGVRCGHRTRCRVPL